MEAEESETSSIIITISELIDTAFGDAEVNIVHHKHIHTVLYILARQLRILERRVAVRLSPYQVNLENSSSSLSVSEVRLQATTESRKGSTTSVISKKGRPTKGGQIRQKKGKGDKGEVGSSEKTTSTSDGNTSIKTAGDKTSSYGPKTTKVSTGRRSSPSGQDTIFEDDTAVDDKSPFPGKESSRGKKSIGKTTTLDDDNDTISTAEKTARTGKKTNIGTTSDAKSDKKSTTNKTSRKPGSGKSSAVHGTSSSDDDSVGDTMSTADKTSKAGKKSNTGKISSTDDKQSTRISSKDGKRTTGDKTSTINDTSSPDISPRTRKKSTTTDKHSIEGDMSSEDDETTSKTGKKSKSGKSNANKSAAVDEISQAGKKLISDKSTNLEKKTTSTRKSTGDRRTSDADRSSLLSTTSSGRQSSSDKTGKLITTKGKRSSESVNSQVYKRLLEEVEETREREMRVIHQRADSREVREKTPTPIASLDSFEATYEKLLVVERIPHEEAQARAARAKATGRAEPTPRLSVVTLKQFQELADQVRQLQKKLAPVGTPGFPENAELMKELRKGASLTDAMAALQLSARLEATEKTLTNMLSVVSDLARQTLGVDIPEGATGDLEVLFRGAIEKQGRKGAKEAFGKPAKEIEKEWTAPSPDPSVEAFLPPRYDADATDGGDKKTDDLVTIDYLETALLDIHDKIMAQVNDRTSQSAASAGSALKLLAGLEKKLDTSVNVGSKMEKLEILISNYAEQINALDTGLSSQLTNYQEDLTQMQHDLETGLETMAEVLANTGGDATAMAELNAHFNSFQVDIDDIVQRQKELKHVQNKLNHDLEVIRSDIEKLRETKADREEVADALRDKAGLGDLNGLISHQQFEAVSGDLEKQISMAYDKFNDEEMVWQKLIDEILRELNEKADIVQIENLREQINHYLEMLRMQMKTISDIVGEPTAAALTRQICRDSACLACSTPAFMNGDEKSFPKLPAMRPPTMGAESPKPKEDGDHAVCYQGYPVKHPIDPRAHFCHRWCGGSHTLINAQKSRVPPSVTVTSLIRKVGQEQGTDGKMYAVDEKVPRKPCAQCIAPSPSTSKYEHGNSRDSASSLVPFDFRPILTASPQYDVTPPL